MFLFQQLRVFVRKPVIVTVNDREVFGISHLQARSPLLFRFDHNAFHSVPGRQRGEERLRLFIALPLAQIQNQNLVVIQETEHGRGIDIRRDFFSGIPNLFQNGERLVVQFRVPA